VTDELAKRYAANRRAVRERLGETPAASSS